MRRFRIPVLLAVAALAAPAAAAGAETRAEYIAQVDPICNQADKRIGPLIRQGLDAWENGRLGKAGRKFKRGAAVFARSVSDVAAVPPPAADQSLIDSWLDLIRRDVELTAGIGAALKKGKENKARKLVRKSIALEKPIGRLIGDYGFNECN